MVARRPTLCAALAAGVLVVICARCRQPTFVGGPSSATTGQRQLKVSCQAVDSAMKTRIESVTKTGKLTDAMRLVAAAKVRRAQNGVLKSRPFSDELQSMIKGLVKKLKGSGLEQELPMLRVPEKVTNVGIVIIASNRGLCGAYNTFVFKKTVRRISQLNAEGIVPKVIVVGKKARSALKTKFSAVQLNFTGTYVGFPDTITSKAVAEVGEELRNLFLSGEVDKVEVIYAKFFNLLKNEPQVRTMLPLTPTGIEDPEDETFTLTSVDGKLSAEKEKVKSKGAKNIEPDVIFDQAPETILNSMLPLYLNSQLLAMFFDAQASELSSRMTAMKAATDNAAEVAAKLTIVYNKKRQAQITQELCEITSAAMSVEQKVTKSGQQLGLFDNEDTVSGDFMQELDDASIPETPPEPPAPADWE